MVMKCSVSSFARVAFVRNYDVIKVDRVIKHNNINMVNYTHTAYMIVRHVMQFSKPCEWTARALL